jgi:mycofactocin precursor
MDDTTVADADETTSSHTDDLLDDELLVEEISIDGMCGVY